MTFSTSTSPPAAATAAKNVPVSMRSGMTVCSAGRSSGHPFHPDDVGARPPTPGPMPFKNRASSTTSGSRAALRMTVTPSAEHSARHEVFRRAHAWQIRGGCPPPSAFGAGPNVAVALFPRGAKAHQPFQMQIKGTYADGAAARQATRTRPCGPVTAPSLAPTPAFRGRLPRGPIRRGCRSRQFPAPRSPRQDTFAPRPESTPVMTWTSLIEGTFRSTVWPGTINAAAINFNVAFFRPTDTNATL